MKGNLFAMIGSLVLAGSLVAAQESQSPAPAPRDPAPPAESPAPAPPAVSPAPAQPAQPAESQAQEAKPSADEMTLTGCLVQGSGPTVFILENAKIKDAKDSKGQSYVLEISAPPDKIKSVVNHSVTIVGTAATAAVSAAPGASNQKRGESDLPKLTAKRITPTSQTCSA